MNFLGLFTVVVVHSNKTQNGRKNGRGNFVENNYEKSLNLQTFFLIYFFFFTSFCSVVRVIMIN